MGVRIAHTGVIRRREGDRGSHEPVGAPLVAPSSGYVRAKSVRALGERAQRAASLQDGVDSSNNGPW